MRKLIKAGCASFMTIVVALCAAVAQATTVQDLTRLRGHERVVLTGMGIVIGLDGTGDRSKDSLVAARPYGKLLANLGYPISNIDELADMDSYAIVMVTMEIPATGASDGERVDVSVDSMFNAKSLEGGRLVVSPLRLPRPDSPDLVPMAFASGALVIEGQNPRSARVRAGGQMITEVRGEAVAPDGTLTLVLNEQYAGYPMATMLADSINDEFAIDGYSNVAQVLDARQIRVVIPQADLVDPADFIAALQTIRIDPSLIQTEARIVINERKGLILLTGDVFVGPVGVRAAGLSITTITPEPPPTPAEPRVDQRQWANLDASDRTSRASTRLNDLLTALDQLNVPVQDQIAIIYEMKKTGALHAEIITQ